MTPERSTCAQALARRATPSAETASTVRGRADTGRDHTGSYRSSVGAGRFRTLTGDPGRRPVRSSRVGQRS
jgi:hypothetical protein